ncbi:MAG: 50S ribosomal protein L25 [Spirochaetes bacterium]|nr:50S ribosomal protein L25 [Spirochaetota bacterium]
MKMKVLEAQLRTETRKGPSRRYRRAGLIPSIIYGQGKNTNILIDAKEFGHMYPQLTHATVINLKVENKNVEVLIKECDHDQLNDQILHIDFYELKKGKALHTSIPVHFVGNAIGIREGGSLEKHFDYVEIECLPKDIVEHFEIDITDMKINDTKHVSDLDIDTSKYKVLTDGHEVLVKIAGKSAAIEEEELAEGEEGEEIAEEAAAENTEE